MDDEGAAIIIEQRIQSTGERDSAGNGIERPLSIVINREILKITEMVGVITKTGIDGRVGIHLWVDIAVIVPLGR